MGWLIPPPWLPSDEPPTPSIAIRVPLPGTTFINASNDVEFPTTILEGDRLHVVEEVVSVSPEKKTRLGTGHFVETCDEFHRADGTLVADQPEYAVPVHACGAAMKTYRRLAWEDVTVPTELAEVVDTVDYQRVVMNPGPHGTTFPVTSTRNTPKRHGHPTIFVNTMHIAGFVDRIATDWAGPYSRVVRRKISLLGSIYAGDTMVGRGRVVDKRLDDIR